MHGDTTRQLDSGGLGRYRGAGANWHRMVLTMLTTVLAACGSSGGDAAEVSGDLHACELLPAVDVSRLAGEAVAESNVDAESANGAYAMSQCTHSFASGVGSLSVHVRRSGIRIGESRQADAEEARASDDGAGFGIMKADAIEAGEDVPGLGALAYTYEFGDRLHLVAYWDEHFSVWVWMQSGPDDRARVLQLEKAAAQIVIDKL